METVQKEFFPEISYPLSRISPVEEQLFFDIETTGFSGDRDRLYLIGCTYYKDRAWHLIQWFADTEESEPDLLRAFFGFLRNFRFLIHFNGDGFDIPFLLKRCRACRLPFDFSAVESIDLYRIIRPCRSLLGLPHMKQKNIEAFLGVEREDRYSGGELIELYHRYLKTHEEKPHRLLLLHNEDDLKGMPSILPILHYPDLLKGSFRFLGCRVREVPDAMGCTEKEAVLTYESEVHVPVPAEEEVCCCRLELDGNRLQLSVPLYEGELKHFYEDYQNYVYLIYEDNAIHKSIGQYVDKEARKKATAKTCYTRVCGVFLPEPSLIFETCLKKDYSDKTLYTPFDSELFSDEEKALLYLKSILVRMH